MDIKGPYLFRGTRLDLDRLHGELLFGNFASDCLQIKPPEILGVRDVIKFKYRRTPSSLKRMSLADVWPIPLRIAHSDRTRLFLRWRLI